MRAWIDPEGYRRWLASKKRAFEDQVDKGEDEQKEAVEAGELLAPNLLTPIVFGQCVIEYRSPASSPPAPNHASSRHREKRSNVPFTEERLTAMRGGLTAEENRWKLIRGRKMKSIIVLGLEQKGLSD